MYASIQKLKNIIPKDMRIYPGHSYGKQPGAIFEDLIKNNIYFQFKNEKDFVSFRERKKQNWLFNFR
ncbi:hypothetical protein GAMM_110026 [Gammaproteobacteria bacterium]